VLFPVSNDDDPQFFMHLLEKYPYILGRLIVIFDAPGTCNAKNIVKVVCSLKKGFEEVYEI
jgi:hypothetical protein